VLKRDKNAKKMAEYPRFNPKYPAIKRARFSTLKNKFSKPK